MAHLSHKFHWESLCEIYIVNKASDPKVKCCPPTFAKQLQHFAGTFVKALSEFRATDKSTDAEMQRYDPKVWGEYEFRSTCGGPWLGYYDSLFWGYLELNLLLEGGERIAPLMIRSTYLTPALRVMIGAAQDEQPDHLTDHLKPVYVDNQLRPLTPEVRQILRDHAAMMFRCMYSVSGENKLLDAERVGYLLLIFLNWSHSRWGQPKDDTKSYIRLAPRCCPWTHIEA